MEENIKYEDYESESGLDVFQTQGSEDDDDLSYENNKVYKNMVAFLRDNEEKDEYRRIYAKFENFPNNVKKQIYTNAVIMAGGVVLLALCIFGLKYVSVILCAAFGLIEFYLGIKLWATFHYLRNAKFKAFTGKIVESYPVGTKLMNNKHFVIKLRNEKDKELCFRYFGNENFKFDQNITLFIRENSDVVSSNYGPLVETYIEAIPTDDIKAKIQMIDASEEGRGSTMSLDSFLDD